MPVKPYCPLSGRLQPCLVERCRFWDPDMNWKGEVGNCLVVRAIQDLREIKDKMK